MCWSTPVVWHLHSMLHNQARGTLNNTQPPLPSNWDFDIILLPSLESTLSFQHLSMQREQRLASIVSFTVCQEHGKYFPSRYYLVWVLAQ